MGLNKCAADVILNNTPSIPTSQAVLAPNLNEFNLTYQFAHPQINLLHRPQGTHQLYQRRSSPIQTTVKLNTASRFALIASYAIFQTTALSPRQTIPDNAIFLTVQSGGADVNFIEVFLDKVNDLSGQGVVGDGATITSMGAGVPSSVNCQILIDNLGELIPLGHLITPGHPTKFSTGVTVTFDKVACASTLLPEPPFATVEFILNNGNAAFAEFQVSQFSDVPLQFTENPAIQNAIQWSITGETGPLAAENIVCAAYSDSACTSQIGQIATGRAIAALDTDDFGNPVPIQCVSCTQV
ncbi:hypothetical protein H2200_008252 [Cladophialophora chaetospira]|uniref:Uncharacterized protein n=1 Tax=Cladophialophora chaetospira TaxID=386627 RepID=A0AA39CGA7_9EURO|nr:hypothetical protein H2200_008252 [Cladophialophora chaetospira]